MYYETADVEKAIKSKDFKKRWINQFETIVGEFPEVEELKKRDEGKLKERPFLKKHKTIRYLIFPVVLILIILDESYIRIKDYLRKIEESE